MESISKMVEGPSLKLARSIPLSGMEMFWAEISGGKSAMVLGSLCSNTNGHSRVQRKEGISDFFEHLK